MSDAPSVRVMVGDCLDVLKTLPDGSVHAVVTDPPYGLGFMGKAWDSLPPGEDWARECLRVLTPGGHLLAFGGSRTWHRLAVAIEDAGFEVRDSIAWLYGSGFPKSLDVSKAIDKAAGVEGTYGEPKSAAHAGWIDRGRMRGSEGDDGWQRPWMSDEAAVSNAARKYEGGTDAAREWQGWGTALKPAFEPIVVARKPLAGRTVAANVLAHGTGAINVDACRVGVAENDALRTATYVGHNPGSAGHTMGDGWAEQGASVPMWSGKGRWPANVILDESMAQVLDAQSGTLTSGANPARRNGEKFPNAYGDFAGDRDCVAHRGADTGGASRFFYVAKAPKRERPNVEGVAHPTVKPLALMRWLVRLVTPPGGTVLDTFAGSGTTVDAALLEGFDCVAIEREADYVPLIEYRIARASA